MENQVQKFDPSTLMQGVKDRIKSTFVSLIPDDQWDQMVQKEIDQFFNYVPRVDDYNRITVEPKTGFAQLIHTLLEEDTKDRVGKLLNSEEYQVIWKERGEVQAHEYINKTILENMNVLFANMLAGPFLNGIEMMRSSLMKGGRTY